ncbi:MAG: alpha/beta fold hydrolase, partial [Myxococcota bacterium]
MATQDESLLLKRFKNLARLPVRKPPPIGGTPADVIHEENKLHILRYRPRPKGLAYDTPILLVPSLINRHYVLDLMPGKSFVEYLVARGHDVYIVDWGTPGAEDRYLTFDDICDTYLGRATRVVARRSARGKAHLLGYCLGGTLTTVFAARRQEHVASLLALAAPVSFGAYGLLEHWVSSPDFDIDALVDATGNVPWQLMQAAFHMLRPTLNLAKLTGVIDRAWDEQFLDGFIALETWGNDNVSFPGACYRRYIKELYRENRLVQGTFALGGRAVRLEDIQCPT